MPLYLKFHYQKLRSKFTIQYLVIFLKKHSMYKTFSRIWFTKSIPLFRRKTNLPEVEQDPKHHHPHFNRSQRLLPRVPLVAWRPKTNELNITFYPSFSTYSLHLPTSEKTKCSRVHHVDALNRIDLRTRELLLAAKRIRFRIGCLA